MKEICEETNYRLTIGIAGAPCTGKSTLSKGLCHKMSTSNMLVELVQEYASDFIRQYGRPRDINDQIKIFREQSKREKIVPTSVHIVTDCPLFLCFIYGIRFVHRAFGEKSFLYLNEFMELIHKSLFHYDILFYLPVEFPPEENETRIHLTESIQTDIDLQIKGFLDLYRLPYYEIKGGYYERLEMCMKIIKKKLEQEEMINE